jgi:hypothetical protein
LAGWPVLSPWRVPVPPVPGRSLANPPRRSPSVGNRLIHASSLISAIADLIRSRARLAVSGELAARNGHTRRLLAVPLAGLSSRAIGGYWARDRQTVECTHCVPGPGPRLPGLGSIPGPDRLSRLFSFRPLPDRPGCQTMHCPAASPPLMLPTRSARSARWQVAPCPPPVTRPQGREGIPHACPLHVQTATTASSASGPIPVELPEASLNGLGRRSRVALIFPQTMHRLNPPPGFPARGPAPTARPGPGWPPGSASIPHAGPLLRQRPRRHVSSGRSPTRGRDHGGHGRTPPIGPKSTS